MDGLVCDACGEGLLLEEDVRYVLKVEGYAAYDPMEISREDLEKDHEAATRQLLDELSRLDPETAQDQVHRRFDFDLCGACWRRFVRDPLVGLQRAAGPGDASRSTRSDSPSTDVPTGNSPSGNSPSGDTPPSVARNEETSPPPPDDRSGGGAGRNEKSQGD